MNWWKWDVWEDAEIESETAGSKNKAGTSPVQRHINQQKIIYFGHLTRISTHHAAYWGKSTRRLNKSRKERKTWIEIVNTHTVAFQGNSTTISEMKARRQQNARIDGVKIFTSLQPRRQHNDIRDEGEKTTECLDWWSEDFYKPPTSEAAQRYQRWRREDNRMPGLME